MVFRQETNLYDDNAIAKKFSSQDTKFEVVQGKISYLISDSEIEEYGSGKGTVTSRLNTAESNIDGNSSLISSLTTQYDTLSGEVTAYESSTNEYKQTTNQTISTITQTVQTKTRTFNTQPTPPYSVNDLWLKDRDLYVCTVAKTSGQQFAETDWTLATKYTSDAALTQFIENTYASDKTTLQSQIDGKIETWNQSDDPSTAWATTAEKGHHTGDLWYRTTDNTTWRYTGSAWVQQDVPTSVIGAINGKAVLWTTQPQPPYTTNDLWVQGSSGDIMKCVNARASGSYVSSDWAKASKYTDDSALNTWLSGTYASDKSSLQTQIDGKIETWSQTSDPSTAWTTTALKNQHKGDLWYNTTASVQKYYRWSGTAWVEITATPPSAIVTTINGKAQIFTGSTVPKPPYYVGDLWFNSTSDNTGDIYTCVTEKTSGTSGTASHWKIRNKYTDDSTFNNWKGNTSYTTFKSFIDQLPNQINLTVEASGKYAAKASIIAEINESTESSAVKIKADRLTLEGDTLINAVNNGTGTVSINADKVNLSAYSTKTYAESLVTQTADEINSTVKGIENSKSSNYKGSEAPTSSNYPAVDWTSAAQKVQHIGDIYYDSTTGYSYQYQVSGRGIQIKFNDQCQTESINYDYVVIYYELEGQLYSSARFGGTSIAGKTFFIPSRIFWVYWHTDRSNGNFYGFSIDSVTAYSSKPIDGVPVASLPDYTEVAVSNVTQIQSAHNPYDNNANVLWKYTHSSSISPNFTGAWIRRKDSDLTTAESSITQLSDQITLKVSKGDIASTINQTAQSVLIDASKINLSGYATFSSLSTSGSTTINGDNITTGSISANRIKGDTLTLGGSSNVNGKLIVNNASGTEIGRWSNTGISITEGSINIGDGKFSVNTSGDFSIDADYLTISNGTILTRSSRSATPDHSSKYEKGNLYWYFRGTEVARINTNASGSILAVRSLNGDINLIANGSYLNIYKSGVSIEPYNSNASVTIQRYSSDGSSPRIGTFYVYTNAFKMNGNTGVSGTYIFGDYSVTITNGIITGVR